MPAFTIQTLFLLYSAMSFSAAILIAALFWNKNDRSARLWMYGCFLTSIATAITVQRGDIPLIISYSLMVTFEILSLLLFSSSIKQLSPLKSDHKFSHMVWSGPLVFFLVIELERHFAGGIISPIMTATSSLAFGIFNLFCLYQARRIGKKLMNPLFLNFLIVVFLAMSVLYFLRVINALIGYSPFAFDLKTYNLIIWFLVVLFGLIRNLTYIVLRLHLGFTEHGRLNNMNLRLSNIVDERNEMIMSLQKLNKSASINALASTIAHEINQPLGATKLNAQFIDMKLESDPSNITLIREINQSILHDINRASEIVKNLSRLGSNQNNAVSNVNVLNSIRDVEAISASKMHASNIHFEIECDPSFFIDINLNEWQQVLINLLNNSIEALESSSKPKKYIRITAKKKRDVISLAIEDNGPGIESGQESQIFELLVSSKQTGTGIGLWLSKDIISRNGGIILASNIASGGACFTIELPLA